MFDGETLLLFVVDTIASERLRVPRRLALEESELLNSRRGDDREEMIATMYTIRDIRSQRKWNCL